MLIFRKIQFRNLANNIWKTNLKKIINMIDKYIAVYVFLFIKILIYF